MIGRILASVAALAMAPPLAAQSEPLRPDQQAFVGLMKGLVGIDTSLPDGSCTRAGRYMADRMKAAGFTDDELTLFATDANPEEGGLVAVLPGSAPQAKPILLIAHIDVVAAKRADWERDPFVMVEEDGYYYARGIADTKALATIWADTLMRYRQAGEQPKRTLKLALTCGEETNGAFNGAEWLAANKRELIDAEFALNEGGGGATDGKGTVVEQAVQVGEKTFATFLLETRNPGGHSSVPRPDNAIYQLVHALVKLEGHEFPLEFTETTRAYFLQAGSGRNDDMGKAMVALANDPSDKAAEALVNTDPFLHSNLRTTCVATMLDAGHARNALAQRAGAYVNCRIFPGHSIESIRDELAAVIADPGVGFTILPPKRPSPPTPPLDPRVIDPMRELAAKYWPGVPFVTQMANGYTDATFLGAVGIPTYGVPGMWGDPDGNGAHGLDERMEVRSVQVGRDYLYELVRRFAD
ncbi:M20/M25/M40 family metallo-hydrolase [Erythrobacter mangrovi]|uniref:M20/M25/M40 family metallo-hydrolase n=1 Tax=Erythrobacter mangrovi TaxID=2739433 RepID=A0A7D3XYQ7_9SPHN|nr:M20/M25/M40 family metallo-hydrolase [Erythrobacter mangrovi]QKG70692.1 M20/M25/M40 family metallo-hydrolase [Erythrobacter mangrovi]